LRIAQRTADSLLLELKNNSNHQIFVSYAPPEGSTTTFLSYSLEKKATDGDDFDEFDQGFHHIPNLRPIEPNSTIMFRLIRYPNATGEYRVRVAYYDDESVYKMISERLTGMNDSERKRADQNRKYVFSQSFVTQSKPQHQN
jgi:hypothetical protein